MSNNQVVNPVGLFYVSTVGIEAYSHPGCIIVASFYTYNKSEVQAARKAGAKVLLYIDWVEIVQKPTDPLMVEFYQGANPWPTLTPAGQLRVNWPGTILADITVGSKWAQKAIAQSKKWLMSDLIDGLFNDVAGGRLYSITMTLPGGVSQPGADWDTWDQAEKDAWTAGCVDILRQQDEFRRANCPRKILVNNNVWTGNGSLGQQGEQHVNGCVIEQHTPDPTSGTWAYVASAFSGMWPRVVIIIVRPPYSVADALKWTQAPGMNYLAYQNNYTGPVPAPVIAPVKTDCSVILP